MTASSLSAATFPHAMTWFEIPVTNFDQAADFYDAVLEISLKRELCDDGGYPVAIFPHEPGTVSGCLSAGGGASVSRDGATLYLLCRGDLDAAVARAQALGGEVLRPVTVLPEGQGRYAVIADRDGNRVGLHQMAA